jgi:hypothetical protein
MSVDFWTKPRLRIEELFDGRLEGWGIFGPSGRKRLSDVRCLADGENYVRVFSCSKGVDLVIASYGFNDPYGILKAISEAFDVEIWLEVDLQLGHHKRVIKRPTSNRAARSSGVRGTINRALYKG